MSIFGGKLTTYRRLAEAVLMKLRPYLPGMGLNWTSAAMLPDDSEAFAGPAAEFAPGLGKQQVAFMMREEWARTADDILWRRSKLGLVTSPEQRETLAQFIASREPRAAVPAGQTGDR